MSSNPILSIIIPTLNSENTIEECLESILKQTWTNFELVIIDGLSSDRTLNLIKSCKYSKLEIKLISEKDNGIYDAMNKGINHAKGDFLYFLGSDDELYSPTTLHEIFRDIKSLSDFNYGNVQFKLSLANYSGESSLEKLKYQQISICHQAIFYSKRIFDVIGKYDDRYFIHADYDLNIKCFETDSITKKYFPTIIARYNETGTSTQQANADQFHDHLTLKYIYEHSSPFAFFNAYRQTKNELAELKKSRIFKLENFIKRKIFSVKRKLFSL